MPHLDFRQAFAVPSNPPSVVSGARDSAPHSDADAKQKRSLATWLPQLHHSDRTTILFAVLVFLGGLFCASYFFNGGEILRAAAAWSREYLYPRPVGVVAESNKIDSGSPEAAGPVALPGSTKPGSPRGNATAPFGRNIGSLNPPPAIGSNASGSSASGSISLPAGPGGLLNELSLPPAGGDALAQTFDRGVAEIARVTALYANTAASVERKTVIQPARTATSQVNGASQTAQSSLAAAQQTLPNAQRNPRDLTKPLHGSAAIISSKDLLQGSGMQGLGTGLGGLGDTGAAGAAGGMGGQLGGALGGMGGMGSGK